MKNQQHSEVRKTSPVSYSLFGVSLFFLLLWILDITPLAQNIDFDLRESLGNLLLDASKVGIAASLINLVFAFRNKENKVIPILTVFLFIVSSIAPGVLMFIALCMGGYG